MTDLIRNLTQRDRSSQNLQEERDHIKIHKKKINWSKFARREQIMSKFARKEVIQWKFKKSERKSWISLIRLMIWWEINLAKQTDKCSIVICRSQHCWIDNVLAVVEDKWSWFNWSIDWMLDNLTVWLSRARNRVWFFVRMIIKKLNANC